MASGLPPFRDWFFDFFSKGLVRKLFPVLLRTTELAQTTSQYYLVVQSLRKALPSTTSYRKCTSQYYFVLRSLHKVLPSTTSYYKACTEHFPVVLRTIAYDNITLTTRRRSHSTANCKPGSPNTMAQRAESVCQKTPPRSAGKGTTRAPNPFLDVQSSFRVAGTRDCAPCQKWAKREVLAWDIWRRSAKMHFPWQGQYKRRVHERC